MQYDFAAIEQRWQEFWEQHKTFRAPNPGDPDFDATKPKYYVLDMFPYPSGVGLHVGHPLGYIATDILARYKRMTGHNVLHPMGYDAFGLPAEQFAVEHGVHPRVTTEKNIANMTRQLKRLGLSYDWDRGLATTDPQYYRWTQWIFLQLYHSYFDPADMAARPIANLVTRLEGEDYYIGIDGDLVVSAAAEDLEPLAGAPIGVRKWHELTREQQRELVDSYRLAYLDEVPVNWCPALGTVLANEEVTSEGRSERGNHPVYKRPLRQWVLRITAYAERLLDDLDLVDWPEPIKLMQRNWIGRSVGAQVDFPIAPPEAAPEGAATGTDEGETISVFTTRPDTLFGATYMVLAPEHPLVDALTSIQQRTAVETYRQQAAGRTDMDRQAEAKVKTGVFSGAYAVNPVNNQRIPIWIADYVLMGYGTGAIMAVPAHDQRDFEFAKQFGLPVRAVVMPGDDWLHTMAARMPLLPSLSPGAGEAGRRASATGYSLEQLRAQYLSDPAVFPEAFTAAGVNVNSDNQDVSLNGMPTDQAKPKMTDWLDRTGLGTPQVQYKLRDWLFSRQRYWGEPFPILHGPDGQIVPLDERDLPVELPPMQDFRPTVAAASEAPDAAPQPPLARADDAWKYVQRDGIRHTREFNTMPQWAGSCWYYLRFIDPHNQQRFVGVDAEQYWMRSQDKPGQAPPAAGGVDLYVGGAEHAVLHLLYSRFWHKVLYDLGHVSTPEPFGRLFNQGYIQAFAYTDARGTYVHAEEVQERDGRFFHQGQPVSQHYGKMGKSLKNAVAPDEMCARYGADSLRLYEMYLGPLDQNKPWRTQDIVGSHRFLARVWRNFIDESGTLKVADEPAPEPLRRLLHKTIKKVSDDLNRLGFNTAIAALIELNNELVGLATLPREVAKSMALMLAPLAPHLAEELWRRMGHSTSIAYEGWPDYDAALLVEDTVEYPVQINGKVKARLQLPATANEATVEAAVRADPGVQTALAGKTLRKVIVIKGRMINIVAG